MSKEKPEYNRYQCPFCLESRDRDSIGIVEMNFANGNFSVNESIHRSCLPKSWGNILSPIALFEIDPGEFYFRPLKKGEKHE